MKRPPPYGVAALAAALVALAATLALLVEPAPALGPREVEALEGATRIGTALSGNGSGSVADAWQRRGGQPPLAGLAQGLSWWALQESQGTRRAAATASLLAGLGAVLAVFLFAWRRFGWLPALGAALLLVASPGFLADLRAARPEPIVGLSLVLLVGAAWAADRGPARAFLALFAFALAVFAHPIGFLLTVPLLLWAALRDPAGAPTPGGGMVPLPTFPFWLLVAPVAGLVLLSVAWPWLRVETGKRLVEYLIQGHMNPHPPFLLLGRVFVQTADTAPPFWAAPLLWALRLPLPVLLLGALGAARGVRAAWRLRRLAPPPPDAPPTTPADRDLLLAALVAVTLLVVHSLNGSPWYEGTDGIRMALPLLALLAAGGLHACVRRLVASPYALLRRLAPAFVAIVVLAGAAARLGAGPSADAAWNALVGGSAGAAREGIQLRPEAAFPARLVDWMNQTLPPKASVTVLPDSGTHRDVLRRAAALGVVRPDLFFGDLFDARWVVLLWEPEHPGYTEAVALLSAREPVFQVEHDGIPLARVYAPEPPDAP